MDNNGCVEETLALRMLHGIRRRPPVGAEAATIPMDSCTPVASPTEVTPIAAKAAHANECADLAAVPLAIRRRIASGGRRSLVTAGTAAVTVTAMVLGSAGAAAAAPNPTAATPDSSHAGQPNPGTDAHAGGTAGATSPSGTATSNGSPRTATSTTPTSASGNPLPSNNGAGSTTFAQTTPQPLSNADRNGSGANTSGPFNATGFGQVQGGHLAGTEGKADNKNPPGQVGNTHSRGYECNVNPGIGNGNPAHTACPASAPQLQTLASNIYQCVNGSATRIDAPGGTLKSSGPSGQTGPSGANSFQPTDVPVPGGWMVSATSPAGWHFAGCSGAQPATGGALPALGSPAPARTAAVTAQVPSGGAGAAVFYVSPDAQNLIGNIFLCQNGSPSTIAVGGGTMGASGPHGETVPTTGANPMDAQAQNPGQWAVAATAPADTRFVPCGTGTDSGTSASHQVVVPTNGTGITNFYVVSDFSVRLHKSASIGDNATITAGTPFSYTLVATNTGGAAATDVVVTDAVPPQLGMSGVATTQGSCSLSDHQLSCNLGTLAANGGFATITIDVTTSTASCGTVDNMGHVTATGGTVGNSNTVMTTITCPSSGISVGIQKTNNAQDPAGAAFAKTETADHLGETFSYKAVITNTSPVPEVIGAVTDSIPGQPNEDVCTPLVGWVLAPGASVVCTFPGVAPSASGASQTDTVTVAATQQGNPANTATATDTSTVLTNPDVHITKANDADGTGYRASETVAPGATSVPYQVVVTNPNSSPGTITALTDTIDGQTTTICPELVDRVLQPAESVTCNFTGPIPTSVTTDTARVTLSVNGVLVSAMAPSTVFPPVLGVQFPPAASHTPAPTALAFTGAPVGKMLATALGMIALGLLVLCGLQMTDRRRAALRPAPVSRTVPSSIGPPVARDGRSFREATGPAGMPSTRRAIGRYERYPSRPVDPYRDG